jgi:DNA-binding transcriptional MerR regulator
MNLYLDIEDTCKAVGITRRQLNYWLSSGLLVPELSTRKFTSADLQELTALRLLIVELGVGVQALQDPERLMEATRDWLSAKHEGQKHE